MNPKLAKLRDRIDALTVRERVLLFAASAGVLVFMAHSILIAPAEVRNKALRAELRQQQNNIVGMDLEILALVNAHAVDPDLANRARLGSLVNESTRMVNDLRALQSALVAPELMAPLLEKILKGNNRLKLVSLKTLAPTTVSGSAQGPVVAAPGSAAPAMANAPAVAPGAPAAPVAAASVKVPLVYRHGVELTVRGNYLDMIDYMDALQAMPTRVFWGKANLEVETYPNARLTLTLYTLSLDEKWMKL